MIVATRKPLMDSGYRNLLRHPPANSVLYYPGLPEGLSQARLPDLSGQGNHGTITSATYRRLPSGLLYLHFDGTEDYFTAGAASAFSFIQNTGVFTIEFWLRFTDYTGANQSVMSDMDMVVGTNVEKGFVIRYLATNDQLQIIIGNGGLLAWPTASASSNNIIADNNWHRIAVLGDGTNTFFQVDGVRETGSAGIGTLSSGDSSQVLHVGGRYDAGTPTITEDLDGDAILLGISTVFRTTAQVANSFNRERHLFHV